MRKEWGVGAMVTIVRVDATSPLAGGVRTLERNAHVGPIDTVGVMVHPSVTAALNPFVEPTVMMEVADPPAATEEGVRGPAWTEKLGFPPGITRAANASNGLPPKVVCSAPVVAKPDVDVVDPVRYALPEESTAMPPPKKDPLVTS